MFRFLNFLSGYELRNKHRELYSPPNIIRMTKSSKRCVGHVARIRRREVHRGFWPGHPKRKNDLEDLGIDGNCCWKRQIFRHVTPYGLVVTNDLKDVAYSGSNTLRNVDMAYHSRKLEFSAWGYFASRPRFETGTSRIRILVTFLITEFSLKEISHLQDWRIDGRVVLKWI
jgi:hypothetical protein